MSKRKIIIAVVVLLSLGGVATSYLLLKPPAIQIIDYQQLDPNIGKDIGASWNPARTGECAVIIKAIAAVQVDNSIQEQEKINQAIIKNTKLAAATLSLLAQQSLEKDIAAWSYKVALLLVQFPTAINDDNPTALSRLFNEVGKMVERPPLTCDNTANQNT